MTTTTATATPKRVSVPAQLSSLAKAELTLLRRNALQLFYAFAIPIVIPFAMRDMMGMEGIDELLGSLVSMLVVLSLTFVTFYNTLSAVVNRREQAVLQRLRAGELRDGTILTGVSMPGIILGILMSLVTMGMAIVILDMPIPINIPLILGTLLATIVLFVLLALSNSVFTKTAESAQISSLPVIMLLLLGSVVGMLPDESPDLLATIGQFLPTAPVAELIAAGWFGPVNWSELLMPALILAGWIVIAALHVMTSFRWNKRA